MIERLDISGVHMELTDDMKKYVDKKIGRLDRFMPRGAQRSIHGEIKLSQAKKGGANQFMCEVILHLPHETMTVKESTINIFAAIDIVEAKLKNRLKKYKDKAQDHKTDRKGVMRRVRRLADRDYWGSQN